MSQNLRLVIGVGAFLCLVSEYLRESRDFALRYVSRETFMSDSGGAYVTALRGVDCVESRHDRQLDGEALHGVCV